MDATRDLRIQFLRTGKTVMEEYEAKMFGKDQKHPATDHTMMVKYWEILTKLISHVEGCAEVPNLSTGEISERVDNVLEQVATGKLSITQGKRLIEMLQAGFEITELPKLVEALAADNIK